MSQIQSLASQIKEHQDNSAGLEFCLKSEQDFFLNTQGYNNGGISGSKKHLEKPRLWGHGPYFPAKGPKISQVKLDFG